MKPNTRGFSEPLFAIFGISSDNPIAVIGAPSTDVALYRAEMVRHLVDLPRPDQLRAKFLTKGPVRTAFFSANFFAGIEDALEEARKESEGVCPLCGCKAAPR